MSDGTGPGGDGGTGPGRLGLYIRIAILAGLAMSLLAAGAVR
jgi:hypothetical protein